MEELLQPYMSRLPEFESAVFALENPKKIYDYLLAACKLFYEKKDYKNLLFFQSLMRDHGRMAITCILLYLSSTSKLEKDENLELANVRDSFFFVREQIFFVFG